MAGLPACQPTASAGRESSQQKACAPRPPWPLLQALLSGARRCAAPAAPRPPCPPLTRPHQRRSHRWHHPCTAALPALSPCRGEPPSAAPCGRLHGTWRRGPVGSPPSRAAAPCCVQPGHSTPPATPAAGCGTHPWCPLAGRQPPAGPRLHGGALPPAPPAAAWCRLLPRCWGRRHGAAGFGRSACGRPLQGSRVAGRQKATLQSHAKPQLKQTTGMCSSSSATLPAAPPPLPPWLILAGTHPPPAAGACCRRLPACRLLRRHPGAGPSLRGGPPLQHTRTASAHPCSRPAAGAAGAQAG